jgi:hypothetical protein
VVVVFSVTQEVVIVIATRLATTCLVNQVYVEPMRLVTNTVAVAPFKPRLKMVGGKLK